MHVTIDPLLGVPIFLLLGCAFGSFGNVLADRLMHGGSLGGRSRCAGCGKTLHPLELVPVISWLALRGRCASCNAVIPLRMTVVELLSGLLFVLAFHLHPALPGAAALAIAFWAMLLIADIDLRTQTIPDVLTLLLALGALAYRVPDGSFSLVPALIGFAFFGVQWIISSGRWVGSGDVFLAAASGLLLPSWQMMTVALFASYIIGSLAALALLLTKKSDRNAHIAFGPFLIAGTFVAFVWGESILSLLLP